VFAAYLLGNLIMLITERVGLPFFSRMLSIPIEFLLPVVMAFCYVGAFSGNNRIFDIGVMIAFGFIGYIMKRFKYPLAPLVVGVILAPLLELNLRRSLMRTDGSWIPILTSPIAAVFLVITFFTVALSIRSELKKGAKKNPAAEG
jgi:putative tricarboxylic transport membrane protein